MPLDAICLQALTAELAPTLQGARIEKVQQPERDLLLFAVHGSFGNQRLLIAAGSGNARVHFTAETMENPAEPPMFCMLLRKHLTGARVLSVTQPEHERLLSIELEARDELGDSARKTLIVEMIGRSSNLILVGADGRIIDCLRRMDFAGDELRRLQPGMIYRMPPKQEKLSIFDLEEDQICPLIFEADHSLPVDRWLLSRFSGLSPLICRELAFRCGDSFERLPEQLSRLLAMIRAGVFTPTLLSENGVPKDFSFTELCQYGSACECSRFDSFSELLDAFYSRRERIDRQRRRSHDLLKSVRTVRDRLQRKLALQREEFRRTEDREEVRKRAELVTANLYRLKKGDRLLCCEDYFQDGLPELRIPLDPLKTPQQNAAALYKEYNKRKAAAEHLKVFLTQGEQQLEYLESVLDQIERAESEKDLAELRRELCETGVLKKPKKGRAEKIKAQGPLRYRSDDGFEILVGRSNLQNDELTTKIARRTDYWLHTQKLHGSHVIVRCEGAVPPDRTLEQAAMLAAFHSRGRESGKVPVDCTMLRFVRKPSGSLPGKVIYTDYRTLIVQADEELENRLRIKK